MTLDRLGLSERLRAIGAPGVVGIALLAFAASYVMSTVFPAWRELARIRADAAASAQARASPARRAPRESSPAAQLHRFYDAFPVESDASAAIGRVYAAAAEKHVTLPQGEYLVSTEPRTGLMRYGIALPVRGSYAQIREFVSASLQSVPTLALDQLSFERPKVSDAEVQAQVRLTLYLRRPA